MAKAEMVVGLKAFDLDSVPSVRAVTDRILKLEAEMESIRQKTSHAEADLLAADEEVEELEIGLALGEESTEKVGKAKKRALAIRAERDEVQSRARALEKAIARERGRVEDEQMTALAEIQRVARELLERQHGPALAALLAYSEAHARSEAVLASVRKAAATVPGAAPTKRLANLALPALSCTIAGAGLVVSPQTIETLRRNLVEAAARATPEAQEREARIQDLASRRAPLLERLRELRAASEAVESGLKQSARSSEFVGATSADQIMLDRYAAEKENVDAEISTVRRALEDLDGEILRAKQDVDGAREKKLLSRA